MHAAQPQTHAFKMYGVIQSSNGISVTSWKWWIRMCLLTSGGPGVIDGSGVSHGRSHGGGDMPHHPCPNTAGAFWRINAAAGG